MVDEGGTSKAPSPILNDGYRGNSMDYEVVLMVRTVWELWTRGHLECLILLRRGGEGSQDDNPVKCRDRHDVRN